MGSFNSNVTGAGTVNGSVIQQGFPTFAANGTVNDSGVVNVTAGSLNTTGFISTLAGNANVLGSDSVISGTLATNQGGFPDAVRGFFTAIRGQATPTPFAGNYSGEFRGTGASGAALQGSFQVNVNKDGAAIGTVTQPGLG